MQQFYSVLQAVALAQTEPDWIAEKHDNLHVDKDMTAADVTQVNTLAREIATVFGINEQTLEEMENTRSTSRSTAKTTTGGKKRKAEESANDGPECEVLGGRVAWVDMVHSGTLGKATVNDLKAVCSALQLAVSGTKAVLVERITNALH